MQVQLPEWAEALWIPKRYTFARGGRGSGKSRSIASFLVIEAAETPQRILCAREVQRSIRDSSKRTIDDEINRLGLRGDVFESTDYEIRNVKNGSLFMFGGLRNGASGVRSMEGVTRFWADEAQAISKASIEAVTPTIRAPGSRLIFSWNPLDEKDAVDQLARSMVDDPHAAHLTVNYDSNPFFPDELRTDMERDRKRDPEKYAHIWLGQYRLNSEALVFRNWITEPFDTPADARFYFGADWGYSIDPTVLVRMFIGRFVDGVAIADPNGRNLFFDYEAYRVGCEIDATPKLFATVPGSDKWPITADSARPETIAYMKARGFNIRPSKKGAGSVMDGIEFLKSFDVVIHPRCKHVVDEFALYSWKIDPKTSEILPVLADKKNHTLDSARYALESLRRTPALPTNAFPEIITVSDDDGYGGGGGYADDVVDVW